MKIKLLALIAVALATIIIVSAVVYFIVPNAMAKVTSFQAGYDHGCSDVKLTFSARYINQPGKGPSFHTQEFMNGYNVGFNACNHKSSSIHSSSTLYKQGYAKGVADAKFVQSKFPASTTMRPDDVDCDSSIDPKASNKEYCSGYQHGFADTINNALTK